MSVRNVTAAVCVAALSLGVMSGCQASASFSAGGSEAKEPKAPPPPPPAVEKPKKAEEPKPAPEPEVKPEPAPAQDDSGIKTEGDSIKLPGNIVFDSGAATLTAGAQNDEILNQLKAYLEKHTKVTLMRVEGHTDDVGSDEDNLKLSGERALTIKNALVSRGIDAKRIIAVGFGKQKPVGPNTTEEGRAQNRRTEFKIAAINGRNYMGLSPKGGGTEFK